jgi:hypothetical protein
MITSVIKVSCDHTNCSRELKATESSLQERLKAFGWTIIRINRKHLHICYEHRESYLATGFHADWFELKTPSQFYDMVGVAVLDGPGWYHQGTDSYLVLPSPLEGTYYFHAYHGNPHAENIFATIAELKIIT